MWKWIITIKCTLRMFILLLVVMFGITIYLAYNAGIEHAINESVYYIVDFDEVTINGNEFDTTLHIDLDGNTYTQGLYIG